MSHFAHDILKLAFCCLLILNYATFKIFFLSEIHDPYVVMFPLQLN